MSDNAKRLAEIKALVEGVRGSVWSWERDHRVADEHMGAWILHVDRGHETALRALILGAAPALWWLLAEVAAASEALDALGVAPGSLAERIRALGALISEPCWHDRASAACASHAAKKSAGSCEVGKLRTGGE